MKLSNKRTGDVLELSPPNVLGEGVVKLNGCIVERCLYSDENGGSVTLPDGRKFYGTAWAEFLIEQLDKGVYQSAARARRARKEKSA
jgi:hypothetical protein